MPAIPVPDLDDPKELYAFAGLALYQANLLEASLINLAAVLQLDRVKAITREVFESTFNNVEAKTLGQLLRATRSLTLFPAEVDAVLAAALNKRNYLAHNFFRKHADDLIHDSGVSSMITELASMMTLFQQADELVTPLYLSLWQKYGVDEATIEAELATAMAEIEAKYSGL